jgi:glutamine cyclotransferase
VFKFGDEVKFKVSILNYFNDNFIVEYYVDNRLKTVDITPPYEYQLSNLTYRLGKSTIKSVVKNFDIIIGTDSLTISINSNATPIYDIEINNIFPHDNLAFTQGLFYDGEYLYESTGLYGRSSLRKVELETGNIISQIDISNKYFCEGMTIWQDKIYQITWKEKTGFIYNKDVFVLEDSFSYSTAEGWGLTHNHSHLIMSDGSSSIYFLNPSTFEIDSTIIIKDNGSEVNRLNELEYIDSDIYSNIWFQDRIARISSKTGTIIGWLDFATIKNSEPNGVLNGIAYDKTKDRLYITGKKWDNIYEVTLKPRI